MISFLGCQVEAFCASNPVKILSPGSLVGFYQQNNSVISPDNSEVWLSLSRRQPVCVFASLLHENFAEKKAWVLYF